MSNKSTNVISNINAYSNIGSHSLIVKPIVVAEKPTVNKFKSSSSENNLKVSTKGLKQKIVSKVRSWSSRDKYSLTEQTSVDTDLAESSKNSSIENDSIENVGNSNLTRARDSLENLSKDEQSMSNKDWKSRSCASSAENRKQNSPGSPKSSPILNDTSKSADRSFWDPFDKKGRKNRKDFGKKNKKMKNAEQPKKENASMPLEGKSCLTKTTDILGYPDDPETVDEEDSYRYKYFPQNSKSVVFTKEVFVVYFNGDEVVYESKEPLKKEAEQQERNKEMRQGHLLKTQEKYNLCLF